VKEEVYAQKRSSKPKLVGTILDYSKPVDRVHFGLVFIITARGDILPKEASAISGDMISIDKLMTGKKEFEKYETWSKCLIPHLNELYKYVQPLKTR